MQQTTLTVFGKVFPHEPWHGDSSPAWYHTHISSFLLLTHATGQLMPPALTSSTVSKKKSLQLIQPPVWRQPPPVSDFLACQPLSLGKKVKISHFTENMGLSNDPVFQFTTYHSMSFFSVRVRPTSFPFLWVFTPTPSPQPIYWQSAVALQEAQT